VSAYVIEEAPDRLLPEHRVEQIALFAGVTVLA
jgi:hypothetical protein